MFDPTPNPRQLDALRLYKRLVDEREDWRGGLVLCCGPGCVANPIPTAVSVAGGTTLAIDADASAIKSAMRSGELDFVVNSLDEALRALKNEVRQHRPLSVGLILDTSAALAEMVERGVQPDLLLIGMDQHADPILTDKNVCALSVRGMPLRLVSSDMHESERGPDRPTMSLFRKRNYESYMPSADASSLKVIDEKIMAILPTEDLIRRQWIQRIPQYLREGRSGGRWIWLSEEEREQLAAQGLSSECEQPGP